MTDFGYTPWIWPLLASAAFQVALSMYLWRRRQTSGARPLALTMLISAVWCLTDAGELAATQVGDKEAWFLVRDALALPGMTASLWFVLCYAGFERWLTRPVVVTLVGAVVALLPLYVVDEGRLLWSRLWWDGSVRGELAPVGAVFGIYGYAIALLGTGLLLLLFVRSPAHRVPVALIVLGQVTVRVAYPLGILNFAHVPNLESMALAVDFASLMYVVALFRFRLFDLVPVAREAIIEQMPDGLLVLDRRNRIADVNATAERHLQLSRSDILGKPAETVLSACPDLMRQIAGPTETSGEATLETADGTRTCEVSGAPLADWQGRPIGRLVVLHDITALRRVETQLLERERALAAAEERQRLARELHDGLAQDLWLTKLKATALATQSVLGSETRALTDEVTAAVDAAIAEARRAVAAMRLTGEGNGSLGALLARSLEDFEDRFGLPVEFECEPGLPVLAPRAEAETLRIVHEALTNVRRHADATVVRVRAEVEDGALVLVIADNGKGFDPAAIGDGVYGLAGMRERAGLIDGEVRFDSAPRKGTRVHLRVPLAEASLEPAAPPEPVLS